jgi:hypothetical protein
MTDRQDGERKMPRSLGMASGPADLSQREGFGGALDDLHGLRDDQFVRRVLMAFAGEACADLVWHADETGLHFSAECSDVFFWAYADLESITPATIDLLEQTRQDLLDATGGDHRALVELADLYAARVRKMRPQGALMRHVLPSLWPLYEACGPERAVEFGNPSPWPRRPADDQEGAGDRQDAEGGESA